MIYEEYKKRLAEEEEVLKQELIDGSIKDYASYRYRVGVIQGLKYSIALFSDIVERMNKDD